MERSAKVDIDIILAAKSGDTASFEKIVEKLGGKVFALCRRMIPNSADAEEAAQEVFVRAWRKLDLYDPRMGEFEHWLMRLASNAALNIASKKRETIDFTSISTGKGTDRIESVLASPNEDAILPEDETIETRLACEIAALPDEYKLILALRYLKDTSYEDIQRITGLPMGTVKNRLYRGREILKERLKNLL